MKLQVTRLNDKINPDFTKVIPRFFNTGDLRSLALIGRILALPEFETSEILAQVLEEFQSKYRNIHAIFEKNFTLIQPLIAEEKLTGLSEDKKLLIGSYFTMEYSLEAAALFNPSIVEDPDQTGIREGEKRVIISFRATGEGHISSLVFKRGIFDKNSKFSLEESSKYRSEGEITQFGFTNKVKFKELLSKVEISEEIRSDILNQLIDPFSYADIEAVLKTVFQKIIPGTTKIKLKYDILSMVNTAYSLKFPPHTLISERVIFPVTFTEKNGIEDARFVQFTDEDGSTTYIATYTAYDGSFILPHLLETSDFLHFKISPLHGKASINKNLALFPRKVNGKYVMLSRIDGVNNFIMFSDDLYLWETATLIQKPVFPWQFVQMGNGGSPIETEKGWLVITHGVGPMRKYCLGASLFDLQDPTIELGSLSEPLLMPNEDERYGYVPNVVYTCGSLIHQGHLILPYAVSDHATSFATVPLNDLLDNILNPG